MMLSIHGAVSAIQEGLLRYKGRILPAVCTHRQCFASARPSYGPWNLLPENLLPLVSCLCYLIIPFEVTCFHCTPVRRQSTALPLIAQVNNFAAARHGNAFVRLPV